MTDQPPNQDLLRSLGRLVRGLSALFWGLPITLVVCFHTARADGLKSLGVLPAFLSTGWLLYGLWQMGAFQRQERVWRSALDRGQMLAMIVFGLSPFLYWWHRMPGNAFFQTMVAIMALAGLLLLASLNIVLQRLGAMLPDEALRTEARQFTALNLNLLTAMILVGGIAFALTHIPGRNLPLWLLWVRMIMENAGIWFLVPLVLLPLAMTMALLWKTKEVILDSVFSGKT